MLNQGSQRAGRLRSSKKKRPLRLKLQHELNAVKDEKTGLLEQIDDLSSRLRCRQEPEAERDGYC